MKNKNIFFMKNLKRFRRLRGLSQGDLAKKSGLTLRIVSYYENHAVSPPIDKIEVLAKTQNTNTYRLNLPLQFPTTILFPLKFAEHSFTRC